MHTRLKGFNKKIKYEILTKKHDSIINKFMKHKYYITV
ncbi:hypothetical protein BTN50_1983 [Candidatus Enterovibrio altilux]|uniref:Uncharacterized protein n=1 Tax=Candidatus Enterovibrio altilux TaxID=1927128 RepID=A0A291BBK0_9GAMM|nr:hypothetical protein BTN50_1983 [Candidatus Enterovibrio luxaltus]